MKLLVLGLTVVALAGCGGDGEKEASGTTTATESGSLTVYSGREEELVGPLFEKFEEQTGVDVDVRYGDSAELAAQLAEEGGNSPADVFFAQDPGSLGAVEERGLLAKLPQAVLERVPERFRDPQGHWVGTSGRSRVIVYNTEAVTQAELPRSIDEVVDPKWKGKVGIAPTNASFQAFVSTMILWRGEREARDWLERLKTNEPKIYEGNSAVVEAAAAGEIELGLVNHYYLYVVKEEQPDAPIENHFLAGDDPGALVSAAGAAILAGAENEENARRFLEFLLSDEGQRFYVDEAEEAEYPLVEGIEPREGLPPLNELSVPLIELDDLGPELETTLELLNEVGFTT